MQRVWLTFRLNRIVTCQATIDELKVLSDRWVDDAKIALAYAMGLFNLSNKQVEIEALKITVDALKAISDRWIENHEIAYRYAWGLVNLSVRQEKAEASKTVDILKAFCEEQPKVLEPTLRFAGRWTNYLMKRNDPDALRAKTNLDHLIQNLETPGNS